MLVQRGKAPGPRTRCAKPESVTTAWSFQVEDSVVMTVYPPTAWAFLADSLGAHSCPFIAVVLWSFSKCLTSWFYLLEELRKERAPGSCVSTSRGSLSPHVSPASCLSPTHSDCPGEATYPFLLAGVFAKATEDVLHPGEAPRQGQQQADHLLQVPYEHLVLVELVGLAELADQRLHLLPQGVVQPDVHEQTPLRFLEGLQLAGEAADELSLEQQETCTAEMSQSGGIGGGVGWGD